MRNPAERTEAAADGRDDGGGTARFGHALGASQESVDAAVVVAGPVASTP
jgi:hypothetical protein